MLATDRDTTSTAPPPANLPVRLGDDHSAVFLVSLVLGGTPSRAGNMQHIKWGRKAAGTFDDLRSTQLRDAVAEALSAEIATWGVSQEKAAARIGTNRSILNRMLRGDNSRFTLGYVVDMAAAADIDVQIALSTPVDRALANASQPGSDKGLFDWNR